MSAGKIVTKSAFLWLAALGVTASLCASCSSVSKMTDPGMSTDARMHVAEVAEAGGDSDTALSMYSAAVAHDPKAVAAQLRFARALARLGRTEQAKQALQAALKLTPGQPDLVREYAAVEVVAGEAERAAHTLHRLTAAKPKDVDALIDEGVALDLSGHSNEARLAYARALKLRPDDLAATNDLAMSFLLDSQFKAARDLLEPFKDRDEVPLRMRNNLAIAYAGLGDMAAAHAMAQETYSDAQLNDVVKALQARRLTDVSVTPATPL